MGIVTLLRTFYVTILNFVKTGSGINPEFEINNQIQKANMDSPEYKVGDFIRTKNGMSSGEIKAITPDGYVVESLWEGEILVQGGSIIDDRHVSNIKPNEEVEFVLDGVNFIGKVEDIEGGRATGTMDILVQENGREVTKTIPFSDIVSKKQEVLPEN